MTRETLMLRAQSLLPNLPQETLEFACDLVLEQICNYCNLTEEMCIRDRDWKAQKDAIREQRRQVEEQQDDSQLSDWERAWRDRVMNRSKENTND